jgi:hypothetical protein
MSAPKKVPTAKRRAVPKKKAAKPAVRKKTPTKKAAVKKLPKAKTVTNQTQVKKIKPKAKDTFVKANPVSLPRSIPLSALSAMLIPLNTDHFAAGFARNSGIFFVFAGALFAFLSISQLNHSFAFPAVPQQVASIICSDPYNPEIDPIECEFEPESSAGTIDCEHPDFHSYPACDTSITDPVGSTGLDQEPDVTFTVAETNEPGIVHIFYAVPYATRVEALAYYNDSDSPVSFGNASQVSDNQWKFVWNTNQYEEGGYHLKVEIENELATYHELSDIYFPVEHSVADSDDPCDSDSISYDVLLCDSLNQVYCSDTDDPRYFSNSECGYSGSICDDVRNPDYDEIECSDHKTLQTSDYLDVRIHVSGSEPAEGDTRLRVFVAEASKVTIFVTETSTDLKRTFYPIKRSGEDEWGYLWHTDEIPDGEYSIEVEALVGDLTYYASPYKISVDNSELIDGAITEELLIDEFVPDIVDVENETSVDDYLAPDISLTISEDSPLHGDAEIVVSVTSVEFIELYAQPTNALTKYFLGLAQKTSGDSWKFVWNTRNVPNSKVGIFARVKNRFGTYDSSRTVVTVFNEQKIIRTQEEETYIEKLEEAQVSTEISNDDILSDENLIEPVFEVSLITDVDTTEDFIENVQLEEDSNSKNEIESLLSQFRNELRSELDSLAIAIRREDTDRIEHSKERIIELKKRVMASVALLDQGDDLLQKIDRHLAKVIISLEDLTERNEEIIKERVGDAVFVDSDTDGVSDYDEVNLYATDPFSADSDNDGFLDGSEILGGFNPNDAAAEALVEYESPQDAGVVRDDVLVVESIVTGVQDTSDLTSIGKAPTAVISGKGLPNSFVTLYIFSTPIVVTVKTGDDGSWSYTFDKELENGEHEVYVGVTDNAGRIVAKSNPLPFIKTAEAFSPVAISDVDSVTALQADEEETAFLSNTVILLILSLAVVMVGLVLLMVGMHIRTRRSPVVPVESIAEVQQES